MPQSASQAPPQQVLRYSQASAAVQLHADRILSSNRAHPTRNTPLLQSLGLVLAHSVTTPRDLPPFDRSTRDGYACRAADLNARIPLRILGTLAAGHSWQGEPLTAGTAIEIMTGAPVPPGADCVVMVEHITEHTTPNQSTRDSGYIRISPEESHRTFSFGENIVAHGSEAIAGEVVLQPGRRITPADVAAAAACGADKLATRVPPLVSILATGDELVPPGHPIQPHQIYNSNAYSLSAQVTEAGAQVMLSRTVPDNREALGNAIDAALQADLLILSGGVSMGKYDLVEEVLASRGAQFIFTGARIQPGKPVVFGFIPPRNQSPSTAQTAQSPKYFFGLPGNPVSTLVTFALFVRPLLAALCGESGYTPPFLSATLAESLRSKTALTRFLPARIDHAFPEPTVRPVPWHGSGDLAALARSNCFLVIPDDRDSIPAGQRVTILLR